MTAIAREVLRDCEAALEDLRAGPTGLQWRTRWAATVTLLRAVGHVLEKVDSKSSKAMATAIKEKYKELKASKSEPQIYWGFIEQERNNILKEYRFSAKQNVTIFLGFVELNVRTGEQIDHPSPRPPSYHHVMADGAFCWTRS
jgi:hypothetical protein